MVDSWNIFGPFLLNWNLFCPLLVPFLDPFVHFSPFLIYFRLFLSHLDMILVSKRLHFHVNFFLSKYAISYDFFVVENTNRGRSVISIRKGAQLRKLKRNTLQWNCSMPFCQHLHWILSSKLFFPIRHWSHCSRPFFPCRHWKRYSKLVFPLPFRTNLRDLLLVPTKDAKWM